MHLIVSCGCGCPISSNRQKVKIEKTFARCNICKGYSAIQAPGSYIQVLAINTDGIDLIVDHFLPTEVSRTDFHIESKFIASFIEPCPRSY